jgi:hypothetical protein
MSPKFFAKILGVLVSMAGLVFPVTAQIHNSDSKSPPAPLTQVQPCAWNFIGGNTDLGLSDRNATYYFHWGEAKPGEKLIFKAQFPHTRYMSIVVYDQKGLIIDSLGDVNIVPIKGKNPFHPGTRRDKENLGEFQIEIKAERAPSPNRPSNTLYVGAARDGKPNGLFLLAYRLYVTDSKFSQMINHPLAVSGGVPNPELVYINAQNQPYCQEKERIQELRRLNADTVVSQTEGKTSIPGATEVFNPPFWSHTSREDRRDLVLGPNDDTIYAAAQISSRFGELLVLRWRAGKSPVETYDGKPFAKPGKYDLRYWSLSFSYKHPTEKSWGGVRTEKTAADFEVPVLRDGTRQIVVGFDGMKRPEAVPPEQWVGLQMSEGSVLVRYVLSDLKWEGDLGKYLKDVFPDNVQQFVPGGVYCSAKDFAANPNIGLRDVLSRSKNAK